MKTSEIIRSTISNEISIMKSKEGKLAVFDKDGCDFGDVAWTTISDVKYIMAVTTKEVFRFSEKAGRLYPIENEDVVNQVMCDIASMYSNQEQAEQAGQITQRDYNGNPEFVDVKIFTKKIICECGDVRYIKPQDAFQVKKCKPCTIVERRERHNAARKAKRIKNA